MRIESLRVALPAQFPLDTFEGQAWLSITPLRVSSVRATLTPPAPWTGFTEVNVRTYVTVGGEPGVYFFSLDANNPLVVAGAQPLFRMAYFLANVAMDTQDGWVPVASQRTQPVTPPVEFAVRYSPTATPFQAQPGSLEYFLHERYCIYSVDAGGIYRTEIDHGPWPLQPAEASVERNTLTQQLGLDLSLDSPRFFYTRSLEAKIWPLAQIG